MAMILGPVEVTYRLSDLFAANFRAWRSYLRRLIVGLIIAFAVIILLRLVIDGVPPSEAVLIPDWPAVLGACVFVILLVFILCPFLGYWRARRRGTLGPNAFSLVDHGIRAQSRLGDSLVYWSSLKRIVASRHRLYLFISPSSAFIIPRRCLSSNDDLSQWAVQATSMFAAAKALQERDGGMR